MEEEEFFEYWRFAIAWGSDPWMQFGDPWFGRTYIGQTEPYIYPKLEPLIATFIDDDGHKEYFELDKKK